MGTLAHPSRLSQVLRLLPRPLLSALDAWSLRVAQRKLEQRWSAGTRRPVDVIDYKVRPWRD